MTYEWIYGDKKGTVEATDTKDAWLKVTELLSTEDIGDNHRLVVRLAGT